MSNDIPDMLDGLLIKVILGEATEEELSQAEGWVRADEDNRRYFEDFKRIWSEARDLAVGSTIDEGEAWTRFQTRVTPGAPVETEVGDVAVQPERSIRPVNSFLWMRVAAVFFLLGVSGWLYYRYSYRPSLQLALRSEKGVLVDTLSDGTIVTLNKASSLKGRRYFSSHDRLVELEGEAFFEVKTDKDRPFLVHTNGITIKVLGTSFNVRSTSAGTEVIVASGQVLVGRDAHFVAVLPQERVLVQAGRDMAHKQRNPDELYDYYRTREFVCNGTPLGRLTEVLNDAYGSDIQLADSSLGRLPLTTVLPQGSLDDILQIVSKTLGLTIEKKEGRIILH